MLARRHTHPRGGSAVIEILVSLGMVAVLAMVIGSTFMAVHRLEASAQLTGRALHYAREYLELMASIKDKAFVCVGAGCSCTIPPGYHSCWPHNPIGLSGVTSSTQFKLAQESGQWVLKKDQTEVISGTPYTRWLQLEDVGSDTNVKQATVTVTWPERGATRQVKLSSVYAAWKDYTSAP